MLEVSGRHNSAMDVDSECSVKYFTAEIAEINNDPNADEDDNSVFPGFCRQVHTTGMRSEEEEDSLLHQVDALMNSPFKLSGNFVTSEEEDAEETPITQKIADKKVKVQVVGEEKEKTETEKVKVKQMKTKETIL